MIIIRKPAHKIYFVLMLTALLSFPMINCNNQGSGDSSSDFAVQPGDVTEKDAITNYTTSFNVTFGGTGYSSNYAVIYSGSINGTSYVGISAGDNPNDNFNSFKLFIYLEDTSITGDDKDLSANNGMIKVIENGVPYETATPAMTIDISDMGDGTYTIHSDNGTVSVGGTDITFNSDIRALRAGN